jgi:hypothetical protein
MSNLPSDFFVSIQTSRAVCNAIDRIATIQLAQHAMQLVRCALLAVFFFKPVRDTCLYNMTGLFLYPNSDIRTVSDSDDAASVSATR